MRVKHLLLSLLTVSVLAPLSTNAQPRSEVKVQSVRSSSESSDLNWLQKRRLRTLHKSMRQVNRDYRREVSAIQVRLSAELAKSHPNKKRLDAYSEKLGSLNAKHAKLVTRYEIRAKDIMGKSYSPQFQNGIRIDKNKLASIKDKKKPSYYRYRRLGPVQWGCMPQSRTTLFLKARHCPVLVGRIR